MAAPANDLIADAIEIAIEDTPTYLADLTTHSGTTVDATTDAGLGHHYTPVTSVQAVWYKFQGRGGAWISASNETWEIFEAPDGNVTNVADLGATAMRGGLLSDLRSSARYAAFETVEGQWYYLGVFKFNGLTGAAFAFRLWEVWPSPAATGPSWNPSNIMLLGNMNVEGYNEFVGATSKTVPRSPTATGSLPSYVRQPVMARKAWPNRLGLYHEPKLADTTYVVLFAGAERRWVFGAENIGDNPPPPAFWHYPTPPVVSVGHDTLDLEWTRIGDPRFVLGPVQNIGVGDDAAAWTRTYVMEVFVAKLPADQDLYPASEWNITYAPTTAYDQGAGNQDFATWLLHGLDPDEPVAGIYGRAFGVPLEGTEDPEDTVPDGHYLTAPVDLGAMLTDGRKGLGLVIRCVIGKDYDFGGADSTSIAPPEDDPFWDADLQGVTAAGIGFSHTDIAGATQHAWFSTNQILQGEQKDLAKEGADPDADYEDVWGNIGLTWMEIRPDPHPSWSGDGVRNIGFVAVGDDEFDTASCGAWVVLFQGAPQE